MHAAWDSAKHAECYCTELSGPKARQNSQEWKGYANAMQRVYALLCCTENIQQLDKQQENDYKFTTVICRSKGELFSL